MRIALAFVLLAGLLSPAQAQPTTDGLQLERVVFLMRHGIRPPTRDPSLGENYARDPWPAWPVDFGLMTPRGAAGIRLLAEADRADYIRRGLLPAEGCLPAGSILAESSAKSRAIRTGEAYVAALLPGCGIAVIHPEREGPEDIMFHPLDAGPADFDGAAALSETLAAVAPQSMAVESTRWRDQIALLDRVLGCCMAAVCAANRAPSPCTLADIPSGLRGNPHDRPDLTGPLSIGSTASQTFLLEYLEGKPLSEVGWGRIDRDQIEALLAINVAKFHYENASPSVLRRAAGPLATRMAEALSADGGQRFTLLFGHDTNIADVGRLLGLAWRVPSYPAGAVPPGGALGFELLRDAEGRRFVRAFFRAQTMDQLRNQQALDPAAPGYRSYLDIPGCATPCMIENFTALVHARLASAARP
ncbi:MAG: histidine-type phosphatase [Sphingomonas sp.]|nr:histidine-type phosphatase [Sphingomonas sp.]